VSKLEKVIDSMQTKFNANAASGLDLTFQFSVEDADAFYVEVENDTCHINKGEHSSPSVVLKMTSETLIGLMDGSVNGMQAFMDGKLAAEGDIMLATKLGELFPA